MAAEKPAPRPRGRPTAAATAAANAAKNGENDTLAKSPTQKTWPKSTIAACRALWEGTPDLSLQQLAEDQGIPYKTMDGWQRKERWRKIGKGDLSDKAQAAADRYSSALVELGPEITTEQHEAAAAAAREQTAVALRGEVLDRHRKEWQAPRQISYEAIKERNFDKAKLAKITAETLMIIQGGERKAWGLDQSDKGDGEKTIVILERESE